MNSPRDTSEDRERIYLALLCQGLVGESQRAAFHALLARYSWKSHDHRAVFDALAGRRGEPDALRAGLPSRLTRLGFPDTDIDGYFAPVSVPVDTALEWLRAELAYKPASAASRKPAASASRAVKRK